jgi:hypothetical protein
LVCVSVAPVRDALYGRMLRKLCGVIANSKRGLVSLTCCSEINKKLTYIYIVRSGVQNRNKKLREVVTDVFGFSEVKLKLTPNMLQRLALKIIRGVKQYITGYGIEPWTSLRRTYT